MQITKAAKFKDHFDILRDSQNLCKRFELAGEALQENITYTLFYSLRSFLIMYEIQGDIFV